MVWSFLFYAYLATHGLRAIVVKDLPETDVLKKLDTLP
jgi:hypothetical protein